MTSDGSLGMIILQYKDVAKLMTSPKFSQASYTRSEPTRPRPFYRQPRFWKIVGLLLLVLLVIRHCSSGHTKKPPKGLPVVLAVAKTGAVPVYVSGLGAVTPTYSVTVRTQINGQLLEVLFKEGQLIKRGDLLAQIDPRPYEALLVQYQGQLMRDQALLVNAKLDLQRYKTLWKQDSVAKQTFDTQGSLVQQDEGTIKIDQGLIQSTELSLRYCRITSPVDGRVGLRLVDPGNYVQTSDATGLAVIDTLSPITVIFTVAEDYIPQILDQINANQVLDVQAYDRSQSKLLATGKLLTMDNQIDATTGTVKLRAQFQNEPNVLFPNQFVNVKLLVTTLQNAIIVPTMAIQHGAQGTFVYAVKAAEDTKESDNENLTVTIKPVVVGVTTDDETTVTSGVAAGDRLIIEGADKVTDGSPVYVDKEAKDPKESPPASTLTASNSKRRHDA